MRSHLHDEERDREDGGKAQGVAQMVDFGGTAILAILDGTGFLVLDNLVPGGLDGLHQPRTRDCARGEPHDGLFGR